MKAPIITMMLCISAAACGETKPANDPTRVETTGYPAESTTTAHTTEQRSSNVTFVTSNPTSPPSTTTTVSAPKETTSDSFTRTQGSTTTGTAGKNGAAQRSVTPDPQPVAPPPPPDVKPTDKTPARVAGTDTRAPDNTKVNERDRDKSALTPIDQGNSSSDIDITAKIRRAIIADNSFSMAAKNVKIITQNGKVTLRGPVNTPQERTWIEGIAKNVAGNNVDNQLEIKK